MKFAPIVRENVGGQELEPLGRLLVGVALAFVVAAVSLAGFGSSRQLVVWAWEQPEDLSFLDPARHRVAILAGTVTIDAGGVRPRPRLQPLRLPIGIRKSAVVRLEIDHRRGGQVGPVQPVADAILHLARSWSTTELQLDFDSRRRERDFHRRLLWELRSRWQGRLSMTALASWCDGDRWLGNLPVDEVVPMAFRMGSGGDAIRHRSRTGQPWPEKRCRTSLGLATDECMPVPEEVETLYLFRPGGGWTAEDLSRADARTFGGTT